MRQRQAGTSKLHASLPVQIKHKCVLGTQVKARARQRCIHFVGGEPVPLARSSSAPGVPGVANAPPRVDPAIAELKPHRHCDEAVEACVRYMEANKDRMRCDPCRKRDLPVGPGVVESACKRIVGSRFKRSGCRWSKAGANALLAAECCIDNNRWADLPDWRACRAAAA